MSKAFWISLPEKFVKTSKLGICQMVLSTWWSFHEMGEHFADGLAFADMWKV